MDIAEVVEEIVLAHISEKPWSDYTEADYTIEQWHSACLVHLHSGPPTSKTQCKLPVKTPNGALNRNGVHAAAAALAGARSPLKASSEQKAKAASALRRYYSQLGETPPDSLKQSSIVDEILEHHGVLGMKWGVRRKATVGPTEVIIRDSRVPGSKRLVTKGGRRHPATSEAKSTREIGQIGRKSGTKALTNKQLEEYNKRLNLEQNFKRLSTQDLSPGKRMALKILGQTGNQTSQNVANEASAIAVKKAIKLAAVAA